MENIGHNCDTNNQDQVNNNINSQEHICKIFWVDENHEIHKTYEQLTQKYKESVGNILDTSHEQRNQLKSLIATLQQREAANETIIDNVQEDRKNANIIKLAWLHNQLDHYFNDEENYQEVA